jgi:hypothetical protein
MPTSKITCQVSYELTPLSECYGTLSLATLTMIEKVITSKVDGTLEAGMYLPLTKNKIDIVALDSSKNAPLLSD